MENIKKLVIVESPVKAAKIQEYLGKEYIVLSCYGHIADLAKSGKNGLGIDIENNFTPKYVLLEDKVEVLQKIIDAAKLCSIIYLASDGDREGAAIAWHLSQRLQDVNKPMKRIKFNEIKKSKILKSISEAGELDMNMVHSQEARRILDRVVGFMASPFLMNTYDSYKLSAGRVQSVVSRMIVDRESEIKSFVPETFFTITVDLTKDNSSFFTSKYVGRPTDDIKAKIIYDELSKVNAKYRVSEVISEEEKEFSQAPLITSTLQRILSKDHGVSPERTMKAAQSLYENGYCTYIRTDSVRTDPEIIKEVRQWLTTNKYDIPKKVNTFKNKSNAQDAHECIRPSDITLLPDNMAIIDPDEKLVYSMIWKYFISSQMTPAVYDTLKVTIKLVSNEMLELKVSGKALKNKGYLEILYSDCKNSKIEIPELVVNDILNLYSGKESVNLEKKQTQPPPRYSEDKLLKELESKNIGRPSTYSELLSKVTARNYVEKKGNTYYPTDLGIQIVNKLTDFFTFMNYDYSSLMEEQLDIIEQGKLNHTDMLKQFYEVFKKELSKAYSKNGGILCDKCNSPMVTKMTKNKEKFLACLEYPSCKFTKNIN